MLELGFVDVDNKDNDETHSSMIYVCFRCVANRAEQYVRLIGRPSSIPYDEKKNIVNIYLHKKRESLFLPTTFTHSL